MVNKGWQHCDLNKMDEETFLFWLDEQHEIDRLKNEAIEEALEE